MTNASSPRSNLQRRRHRRRGYSLVVVMGLMTIALAVSYSMLRTQSTTANIQSNSGRVADARQAAITGMNFALRKIHEEDWQGVDVPLAEWLDTSESFQVTFQTGDDSLTSDDPNYAEYPFRLTIISNGYAHDPSNHDVFAKHQVRAVVQLVRRAFSEQPSTWSEIQDYTVYQWNPNRYWYLQFPVRIEGPTMMQGVPYFCREYPDDRDALSQYLTDLRSMNLEGRGDFRPLSGPLSMSIDRDWFGELSKIETQLGVQVKDVDLNLTACPVAHPGEVNTYRLYPGGAEYNIPILDSTLSNVALGPEQVENPLGIFRAENEIELQESVTINGSLISHGRHPNVSITGSNVHLGAVTLPTLDNSVTPVKLPTLIGERFYVDHGADNSSLSGLLMAERQVVCWHYRDDLTFHFSGRMITGSLLFLGQWSWHLSGSEWEELLAQYLEFPYAGDGGTSGENDEMIYFPEWLESYSLPVEPTLTVKPESGGVTYHWQNWQNPIYAPHPDDDGLRWDLIDWQDRPTD